MNYILKPKGFTLIEVLIALTILSVAFLALAGLMVQSTKNNSFSGQMTEAATLAQDKLEELRATSWLAIVPGADQKIGSNGMQYARDWDVAINGSLKTITITINWTDKTPHSIRLLSVLSQ